MRRLLPLLLLLLVGCGASGDAETSAGDAVADAAGGGGDASSTPETVTPDATEPIPNPCPTGHVPGADGACMAVGIQGCAEMFIDPETGLCDPRPEDCPPGHIPIFSEGCVRVGVVDCHPDFIHPESGHCDPDPDGCDPYHIPVPTQGCVSLDPPEGCGDGTWGNVEALDGDVYVDIGYLGGGSDGSRDKPYTLIEDATDAVQDGGRVILAAGDYPEGVRITKSFEFVGRCASMVTLSGVKSTTWDLDAVIRVSGVVDAAVMNVTMSGPGLGFLVYEGATLEVTRAALMDNQGMAFLVAMAGTSVDASDVLIARTEQLAHGRFGRGINLQAGAKMTLTRANLVDNVGEGLLAAEAGTSAEVTDVLVARTKRLPDGTRGRGFSVEDGATLKLTQGIIVESAAIGIVASGHGASASVSDVLIARTRCLAGALGSRGVGVQDGANVTLLRGSIQENCGLGIYAADAGTELSATDVLVARTQPLLDGTVGRGLQLLAGATLTLARASVVENHEAGLMVTDVGTSALVSDVQVARTQLSADGNTGVGIVLQRGADLYLERGSLVDNYKLGLLVAVNGTTAEVQDVLIARTQPDADGVGGRGVVVQSGAVLSLTGGVLVDNHAVGLYTNGVIATVSDTLIADTQLDPAGLYGDGLTADDAVVTASGVIARGNARAGFLYSDSGGEITGCIATENTIGLVTQTINLLAGPDIADDNVFEGNTQDLMTDGDLAVPDEVMAIPDLPDFD